MSLSGCTHHHPRDHAHCDTCGIAVFRDAETGGWPDHQCPPGFQSADEVARSREQPWHPASRGWVG